MVGVVAYIPPERKGPSAVRPGPPSFSPLDSGRLVPPLALVPDAGHHDPLVDIGLSSCLVAAFGLSMLLVLPV